MGFGLIVALVHPNSASWTSSLDGIGSDGRGLFAYSTLKYQQNKKFISFSGTTPQQMEYQKFMTPKVFRFNITRQNISNLISEFNTARTQYNMAHPSEAPLEQIKTDLSFLKLGAVKLNNEHGRLNSGSLNITSRLYFLTVHKE